MKLSKLKSIGYSTNKYFIDKAKKLKIINISLF